MAKNGVSHFLYIDGGNMYEVNFGHGFTEITHNMAKIEADRLLHSLNNDFWILVANTKFPIISRTNNTIDTMDMRPLEVLVYYERIKLDMQKEDVPEIRSNKEHALTMFHRHLVGYLEEYMNAMPVPLRKTVSKTIIEVLGNLM